MYEGFARKADHGMRKRFASAAGVIGALAALLCAPQAGAVPPTGSAVEPQVISIEEFKARFGGDAGQETHGAAAESLWMFENAYSHKLLDANPTTPWNGGQVYLWSFNFTLQQFWVLTDRGGYQYTIRAYDGRVLDAYLGTESNFGAVTRYDYYPGHTNQLWTFRTDGSIRSVWHPERCLDGNPDDATDPQTLYLYQCNGRDWQKWLNHQAA
ncbi:RICIN domain-containing protein [Streptomyces sp. MCAF7]